MPPAERCMFTPAMSVEIGKAPVLTWRAQPPSWTRFGAMLNEDQNSGMPPTSVGGGLMKDGRLLASAGFCGPGSERAWGLAFIAPCGGRSGLPNTPAAWAAAVMTPPTRSEEHTSELQSQ